MGVNDNITDNENGLNRFGLEQKSSNIKAVLDSKIIKILTKSIEITKAELLQTNWNMILTYNLKFKIIPL